MEENHAGHPPLHPIAFEALPLALYSLDCAGTVLTWNRAAESTFGWRAEEVIGRKLPIIPAGKEDEFTEFVGQVRNGETIAGADVVRRRRDGTTFPGRLFATGIRDEAGVVVRIVASLEDVSEQKQAERKIVESEERFRTLVEAAPEGIFIIVEKQLVYVNPIYVEMLEASGQAALLNTDIRRWTAPEEHEIIERRLERLLVSREPVREARRTLITTTGRRLVTESVAVPFNFEGRDGALCFVRDITHRDTAANERQRLLQAIEQASDAIIMTDVDGIIQYVNPAFERISGYSSEEAVGQTADLQRSAVHDEEFFSEMWSTIRSGEVWRNRVVNRSKDNELYTQDVSITPVVDARGDIVNYVAVQRDVTRELELEHQLGHAQKMESIGRLAGGVAHDFNNMLNVILGYTELALGASTLEAAVRKDLQEVKEAAEKSARLIGQLLGFARQQPTAPEILYVNDAISGMVSMLQRLIGENIELIWHPPDSIWSVRIDTGQLDQIITNLAVNARDAIKGNGKLIIELDNVTLGPNDIELAPGRYVRLRMRDTGIGMDAALQEQIFEPFFTTKDEGYGTGLGLSTVYGIVKQNKGCIAVESEPGKGSTFTIYLPAFEVSETAKPQVAQSAVVKTGDDKTILLVEDEAALLGLGKRMLERLGYRVLATQSPMDAIDIARKHHRTIDLLLTDIVMPHMSGSELARAIRDIDDSIKIVFASGYARDTFEQDQHHDGVFVQKPYSAQSLASKIAETLG